MYWSLSVGDLPLWRACAKCSAGPCRSLTQPLPGRLLVIRGNCIMTPMFPPKGIREGMRMGLEAEIDRLSRELGEALQALAGRSVGLVTAPGGRGLLADALVARGANLLRANVYTRVADTITPASWQRLSTALARPARTLLALSSGEALQLLLAQVPANLADALREARVVAASERLAQLARDAGFAHVSTASSARPAALVSAGIDAFV